MADITLLGASYTDVPAVTLPKTGGGTVTFYENGGGSITMEDVPNSTGTTLVITTSATPSEDIPLNTQLIDYTAVVNGYIIEGSDGTEHASQWSCCSDFTKIDPTMTFTYVGYCWYDMAFYDSNKTYISGAHQYAYEDSRTNDYAIGTLTPARIPSNAAYIRISSYPTINPADQSSTQVMSLIRTA